MKIRSKRRDINRRVAEILQKSGWQTFDILDDSANGPDLTIARNGKSFRVEVKSVVLGNRCTKIKSIGKSGRQCEVLAILMPDNETVILQPMKDHLALCNGKERGVTMLVELNSKLKEMLLAEGLERITRKREKKK